jgi:LmbE family N-acetylglucosaminyl deacetylase
MRRFLAPLARRISDANLLARSIARRDIDLTMPPTVRRPDEPLLVIAPHADDEAIGCGGTLALAAQATIVLLTGDAQRHEEARDAARSLGVTDLVAFGLDDQRVSSREDLAESLRLLLEDRRPATILIPFPLDRHRDHVAAARATAAARPACELWCYEVWTPLDPNRLVDISSAVEAKRAAISLHRSQVAELPYADAALGLNTYRALLAPGATHAEAFLRVTLAELNRLLPDRDR